MTGVPPASPPPPTPTDRPVGTGFYAGRERPFWGEIDVLLAIVWFAFAMVVASIVTLAVTAIAGVDLNAATPVYAIFFGTLVFQALQATFPWLVSRNKGLGIEHDWKFVSSLPGDIGYGLLMAIACFIGAQVTTVAVSEIVGLSDPDEASNTAILVDNQGSPWLIGVIFLIVVGAPLAEELLFRGLILRVLQKSFGAVFAVCASSLLFALPHWQPEATWQETAVLLSALGVVGLVLAIGAVVTDRLGPSVIAHFFFNAVGTIFALM